MLKESIQRNAIYFKLTTTVLHYCRVYCRSTGMNAKKKVLGISGDLKGFKRVAQGSNFVFEGSNRTILDLRGLSTDF